MLLVLSGIECLKCIESIHRDTVLDILCERKNNNKRALVTVLNDFELLC